MVKVEAKVKVKVEVEEKVEMKASWQIFSLKYTHTPTPSVAIDDEQIYIKYIGYKYIEYLYIILSKHASCNNA